MLPPSVRNAFDCPTLRSKLLASADVYFTRLKDFEAVLANSLPLAPQAFQEHPYDKSGKFFTRVRPGTIRGDNDQERPRWDPRHMPGFELVQIDPGSILESRGLRPGDIIMSIDGQTVCRHSNLKSLLELQIQKKGEKIRIVVNRGGELHLLEFEPPHR